jgi:predicted negative regulator of RcsB-dependent stress response
MLDSSNVLNLIEDRQIIKNIISEYLAKTPLLTWKYEDALKILLGRNLRFEPSENNLKTLGDVYIEVQKSDQARNNVDDGSKEKEKIESLSQCIYEICTATRIKKLAQYSTQFIEEVEMNTLAMTKRDSEAVPDTTQQRLCFR